ncbi:MAG: glutamine-hydrolyzing carbamoyl-phosphate synthase small subunit [Clostridia bacterium]
MERIKRKLVLEDGTEFIGTGFGSNVDAIGEVAFNTSMAGYQEIISDPSYTDQIIVMSYPIIGSYGITDDDFESRMMTLKAFIVRDYNDTPSNFRYTKTLDELLEENGVPGLEGIDTRKLVKLIRSNGNMVAMLVDADRDSEEVLKIVRNYKYPTDEVSRVSCKKRWYSRTPNHQYNVVAVDCGIKLQMIRELNRLGCNVTVVPYNIKAEDVLNLKPDGLYLSNGPGDPTNVPEVVDLIKQMKGRVPIMGVCLGHQLIALAYGGNTYKLKFGHRGGNHPVVDKNTGLIQITSQNHGYAVDEKSLESTKLKVTHINILDKTVEGIEDKKNMVFSVQFHPESAPGPNDSLKLFDKFIDNMCDWRNKCQKEKI